MEKELLLTPGKHNEVQVAVCTEFAARFAPSAKVLYLGDTGQKDLYVQTDDLNQLGLRLTEHSKLPDVVIYDPERAWLFLVEVVTSHGPVSPKRMLELEDMLQDSTVGKVYVTAFTDKVLFRKYVADIAWETEVWIAYDPDHMIHFNGDRFIGPR